VRWIFRLVAVVIVLLALALAAVFLIPAERIARLAASRFEAQTGRALEISGPVRPTLYPRLGVSTGAVTIANADWSKAGPMVSARKLSVGVDLMALLSGSIVVDRLKIVDPVIRLEIASDGRANWNIFGAKKGAGKSTPAARAGSKAGARGFALTDGDISNGTLSFTDHRTGNSEKLSALDLKLGLAKFNGTGRARGTVRINGQSISFSSSIDGVAGLLAGNIRPLRVTIAAGKSRMTFDGRAGISPVAGEGTIDAELKDHAFFAAAGQTLPTLPEGLGRGLIGLAGKITLASDGSLALRGGKIRLDKNTLAGDADLTFAPRAKLVARLKAGPLDLAALGGGDNGAGSSAGATQRGWSKAPIDASGLGALDADIRVSAPSVKLAMASLGAVDLAVRLVNGRAVIGVRKLAVYGGNATGKLVVNGRKGLSASADLNVSGVKMSPLLKALAGNGRLSGAADMRLNLLASGNSLDALMRSLQGNAAIKLGKGEILGLDIVGMIRNLDTAYQGKGAKTIFDSIAASFTIDNGVARNSDLTFLAPLLTASGSGSIDIGRRSMTYRVDPVALKGTVAKNGIRVPVLISGPWSNLSFRPDLSQLVNGKISAERTKLKARAKAAVAKAADKLKAKLGAKPGPGTSTTGGSGLSARDALKLRLREQVKKGLSGLLGNN